MRDELQIARWRDGSDVVPTFPAALPPRGVAEPRRRSRTGAGAPARARVWRTSSLAAEWSERSERNAVENRRQRRGGGGRRKPRELRVPWIAGFLDSATPAWAGFAPLGMTR